MLRKSFSLGQASQLGKTPVLLHTGIVLPSTTAVSRLRLDLRHNVRDTVHHRHS